MRMGPERTSAHAFDADLADLADLAKIRHIETVQFDHSRGGWTWRKELTDGRLAATAPTDQAGPLSRGQRESSFALSPIEGLECMRRFSLQPARSTMDSFRIDHRSLHRLPSGAWLPSADRDVTDVLM